MSNIQKKALYIGAGHDVIPYLCFKDITTFISIDSEPIYGQGDKKNKRTNIKYIDEWINKLIYKMTAIGYHMDSEDINLIIFRNDLNQSVRYYYNIIFPDFLNYKLRNELSNINVVIDIGHHPHSRLLNLLPLNFDMICSTTTIYKVDEYPENNIFDKCLDELLNRVKEWYLIINNFEYDYEFKEDTIIKVIKLSGYDELINCKKDILSKL